MTPARGDDSMERRVGQLEIDVGIILTTLKTHGEWIGESRAFHREMSSFKDSLLAAQTATREEQGRRHRSNASKLNVIMALIACGTLLLAIASFMAVNFFHNHADMSDPVKIFHSHLTDSAYAERQNSADLPGGYQPR